MMPPPKKKLLPPPPKAKLSLAIQDELISDLPESSESDYTSKILAPIYEPKNRKPDIFELVDRSKATKLIGAILDSKSITEDERKFLIAAAGRHNVFNYKRIADYYAHASEAMQELMEESALVIVDFDSAIQNGFVKYSEEIKELYINEFNSKK